MSQPNNAQIYIIKVGGALLEHPSAMADFMSCLGKLLNKGQKLVLVHGGGCIVEQQLTANGMQTEKLDGLRVTPKEQIPIITGALAGTSNKCLQAAAMAQGIKCVGLSLADANLTSASIQSPKLGCVGQVTANNSALLDFVTNQGWLAIISSIAIDEQGQLLNVNADQAASAITSLVNGKLYLLSDVTGVLDAQGQLVEKLNPDDISQLIDEQVIQGGMMVKVKAALDVAKQLNDTVNIASWQNKQQLAALIEGQSIGTAIYPN